jgi:hypothetical protein
VAHTCYLLRRQRVVQSQPGQIVHSKQTTNKSQKRAGGVAQGMGPEFKPQYCQKKKKKKERKKRKPKVCL